MKDNKNSNGGQRKVEGFLYLGSIIRIIIGPLTSLLLATKLTQQELGVYYVFGSILAFQQVAELGLLFNLQRKLARSEFYADENSKGKIEVNQEILNYIRFTQVWYCALSLIVLLVLGPVGFIFISSSVDSSVDWELAWVVAIVFTACYVSTLVFPVIIENLSSRLYVAKVKAIQGMVGAVGSLVTIYLGYGLFTVGISVLIPWILSLFFYGELIKLMKFDFAESSFSKIFRDYVRENWRISIVWSTGFFYWNCLILTIFKLFGAADAGKFGLTSAALMALAMLSLTRMKSKIPIYANLISSGASVESKKKYYKDSLHFLLLYSVGSLLIYVAFYNFNLLNFREKLLEGSSYVSLTLYVLLSQYISWMGNYARLKGGEPFFYYSLVSNLAFPVFVYYVALFTSLDVLLLSVLVWHLLAFLYALRIFEQNRFD